MSEPNSPGTLALTGCVDLEVTADTAGTTASCTATSAGGSAAAVSVTVKRDATKPAISPLFGALGGSNGWVQRLSVSWQCGDAMSGIASGGCPPMVKIVTEGAGVLSPAVQARDNAGNVSDVATRRTVNLDGTPPVLALRVAGTLGANGWYTSDVTVGYDCSDATSGVWKNTLADVVLTAEGAGQHASVTGNCTDRASLTSWPLVPGPTFNIDKTPPKLAPSGPAHLEVGADARIEPNASDSTSGVASASCAKPDTSSAGSRTLDCTATDRAGLVTTVAFAYEVDATTPTPSLTTSKPTSMPISGLSPTSTPTSTPSPRVTQPRRRRRAQH